MDNSNKIVPPHLNAEVYRTDTTGTNTISNLDHLQIHPDGTILVGCSELTGRYWNGGCRVFKTVAEGEQLIKESKMSVYLSSGTADGCFVEDSSRVLLCEDSGAVSIWSNNKDAWQTWNEDISVAEHDNAVLGVDCLDSGKEYVTVGGDGNIKVWDISEMICIRNYIAAHNMAIYGVAVQPKSLNTFVTASLDQYVSLWSENVAKPIADLVKNDCAIRCVQWLDDHQVVYGDEAGVLRTIDIRNTDNVQKLTAFPAPVHKLAVNSGSTMVAVCCDNKIVTVCDISEPGNCKTVYHDRHMHSKYVRSVAWDVKNKNDLITIGWDGAIKTHKNIGT